MLKNIKRNLLAMFFVLASIFIVSGEIYGAGEDKVYEANSGKRMGTIDVEYSYYEDESERHKITGRHNAEVFYIQNPVNIKDSAKALAYLKPDGKTIAVEVVDLVVGGGSLGDIEMSTIYKEHTYQSGGQTNYSIGGLGPDSGDLLIRISGGFIPSSKPAPKPTGNWQKNNTGWWYQFSNGTYPKNRWEKINNKWYYFNNKGYIETGWTKVKNKWYYLNSSGAMQTGWTKVKNKWYYMNSSGAMQTGWTKVKNKWYYLNSSGMMQTGWTKVKNKWYYMNASGAMQTGWTKVKNRWYYLNSSGAMQTGWTKVKNKWYYLNPSGAMQTDWTKVKNKWYYLNSSGAMETGWTKIKNKWYYLNASGVMQTGWTRVSNKWYYMNPSGVMETDWVHIKGEWYYMNTNGVMQTGWKKIDNQWYYLYSNGSMARDTVVNGYPIDVNGVWHDLNNLDISLIEKEIVKLVNQLRLDKGIKELKYHPKLNKAAKIRSEEISMLFSTTRPNDTAYFTILDEPSIDYKAAIVGENIGKNYVYANEHEVIIAKRIFRQWYNSSEESDSILNPDYEDIGVGVFLENDYAYTSQIFGVEFN